MELKFNNFKKFIGETEVQITIFNVNDGDYYTAKIIDVNNMTEQNPYGIHITDDKGSILKYNDHLNLKIDLQSKYDGVFKLKSGV